MLEAARGKDAGHNGAYGQGTPAKPADLVVRAHIQNGKLVYKYYGPKDLPPGTYTATLVVVR